MPGVSDFCILHYKGTEKDVAAFKTALEARINKAEADPQAEWIDLTGVTFPAAADFRNREFKKNVAFDSATFSGFAGFYSATFSGEARFDYATFSGFAGFYSATFSGDASYDSATFSGEVRFDYATFSGDASFDFATFSGEARFNFAKFSGDARFAGINLERGAYFIGCRFLEEQAKTPSYKVIRFIQLPPETARRIRLENVSLARVSFLRSDVHEIQFNVCNWPKQDGRNAIYDEIALYDENPAERNYGLVAELYRQLRINLESNKQEIEAGDFYRGQMAMRRLDKTNPLHYRLLLRSYNLLANYGESIARPLIGYFLGGALLAFGYLLAGFNGAGNVVHYHWGLGLPNIWDYLQAYVHALTAGGLFSQSFGGFFSPWAPVVRYVNTLWDVLMVTLLALALRRRFHR